MIQRDEQEIALFEICSLLNAHIKSGFGVQMPMFQIAIADLAYTVEKVDVTVEMIGDDEHDLGQGEIRVFVVCASPKREHIVDLTMNLDHPLLWLWMEHAQVPAELQVMLIAEIAQNGGKQP
jgi:hypothetical protein